MLVDSESNHVNSLILTGILFKPTSKKASTESIVIVITEVHVINWDPTTPTFLPKNPDIIDPSKGKNIIDKYMYFLSFLFKVYSDSTS